MGMSRARDSVVILISTNMEVKKKKYSCDRCGVFQSDHERSLVRHIKNIHEGVVNKDNYLQKKVQKGILKCTEVDWCTYKTSNLRNLKRHVQAKHRMKRQKKCLYCNYKTSDTKKLMYHKKEHRNDECLARHHCSVCKLMFSEKEDFENHLNKKHPKNDNFELIQTAFSKKLQTYCLNIRAESGETDCLWNVFKDFKSLCRRISAKEFPVFSANICMYGVFEKSSPDNNEEEKETEVFILKSTHFIIKPHSKIKNIWSTVIKQFDDRIENVLMKGSGYSLKEVMKIHVEIAQKKALRYSCQDPEYRSDIALEGIYGKRHLTNMTTKYNCFLACLTFHFAEDKIDDDTDNPPYNKPFEEYYDNFIHSLNYNGTGISGPYQKSVNVHQIKKLLKANKKILGDLQINIFGLFSIENQEIYVYESGIGKRVTDNVLNLLSIPVQKNVILKKKKKVKTRQHLVRINNLDAFMSQKTGKSYNQTKRKLCLQCFNFFKNDSTLKKHKLCCNNPRGQVEAMPEEGDEIGFNSWDKKFPSDVVGFLDFETVQADDPKNPEVKNLLAYQYSLVFVDKFNNLLFEKREFSMEGKAGDLCLETLLKIEKKLFAHARRTKELKMTRSDKIKAKKAKKCHICEKEFQEDDERVRDHCHYSSKFLG